MLFLFVLGGWCVLFGFSVYFLGWLICFSQHVCLVDVWCCWLCFVYCQWISASLVWLPGMFNQLGSSSFLEFVTLVRETVAPPF